MSSYEFLSKSSEQADALATFMRNELSIGVDTPTASRLIRQARNNSTGGAVQWSSPDGYQFRPVGETQSRITPGLYEIDADMNGIFFQRAPISTEGLVRLFSCST